MSKFSVLSLLLYLCFLSQTLSAQNAYFFPDSKFNSVQSPEQFLGYSIGSHHTRYDRMVAYLDYLARVSDRVQVQTIGYTYEHRPQLIVTFSTPQNLVNKEQIKQQHQQLANPSAALPSLLEVPLLYFLGYNVHGNEATGGEAALLTAYYLAASEDPWVLDLLSKSLVFMEPVFNPDGRDRFVNWVNMHKGTPTVSDPADREHNEVWPNGRGNHYWFDLNRDWYLAVHKESQNRLRFYHEWYPNVVTDHHEMGTNATFFFEPSKASAENPLVPSYVYKELNEAFATHFTKAMNNIGALYYSKESFDNLYPGYGSSYPDLQGGIGFLFEQASSRGHRQDSQHGVLEFSYGIRNQLVNALATLRGGHELRDKLLRFKREFFSSALQQANQSTIKGYLVSGENDPTRSRRFMEVLSLHQIEAFEITKDQKIGPTTYKAGDAFFVPTKQPQYRMIQSIFERPTKFTDSLFYDASAWNLPLAFGLPFSEMQKVPEGLGKRWEKTTSPTPTVPVSSYGYLLRPNDFSFHQALYRLQKAEIVGKVAKYPFSIQTDNGLQTFERGTLLIPVGIQRIAPTALLEQLTSLSKSCGVTFSSVSSGYSKQGPDLGSNLFQAIEMPKAAMIVGNGVNPYEAGEVWFMMDQYVGMPITKIDIERLPSTELNRYNVLVMVDGQYSLNSLTIQKIKSWVTSGNTLITFKAASEWAIRNEIATEQIKAYPTPADTARRNFDEAQASSGALLTRGAIFEADLDITHPLGYGYTNRKINVYRNSNLVFTPSKNNFTNVVAYSATPLLNGYVHPRSLNHFRKATSVISSTLGSGRVVLFTDNPNFRGTWLGTSKLFFNGLFFGPLMSSGGSFYQQH